MTAEEWAWASRVPGRQIVQRSGRKPARTERPDPGYRWVGEWYRAQDGTWCRRMEVAP